ncbi:RAB6-interacting golgin isoform X2 [Bufo gargarizans]|uniref:RAB6-interacting golgin isoform X2 n=1 Tax=Bufo gargarizans TaxID=30331 RepID=UPI001CF1E8C0|nr:RAB6-interacting golgin isoform X2 [Bufo gargarizans]
MSASARMAGWAGFSEDELQRMRPPQELPYPRGPDACLSEAFLSHPQHQTFPKKDKAHHSPSFQKNTSSRVHLPNSTQVRKALEEKPKEPVADNKEITSEPPSIRAREDDELSKKEVELAPEVSQSGLKVPGDAEALSIPGITFRNFDGAKDFYEVQQVVEILTTLGWILNREKSRLIPEKKQQFLGILLDSVSQRSFLTSEKILKIRKEKSCLKQLQLKQRLMEEKNKRKKALLAKAIDERKRYDRAESEYVAAKLDLYKKTQVKEQLTEHLCTIIQQNELRKAKKLEELMQQLEVEADEEILDLEIEVEQMLQQQETETRKPLVSSTSEKSQQVSKLDCSKLLSEKEFTTETDQGQFMTGTSSNIGDTNKINQKDSVHSVKGDSILS